MKIGLILEGGGMRGMYTTAIMDYFLDTGLPFNGIFTVSAGALFGINFLSKDKHRGLRYNLNYIRDKRYISFQSLLKTGNMINEEFAFHTLPNQLDPFNNEIFRESGTDFIVTVTNINTGQPEYFKITDAFEQIELLRATSALPFISKPVDYKGNLYLDGGVSDSIPYQKAMSMGYDKIIVILTRPIQYRKSKPNELMIDFKYRHFPEFKKTLKNRYLDYNQSVESLIELEHQGKVKVLRPSKPINIKRLENDPQKLVNVYKLGLADIQASYPSLIDYLKT